MNGNASGDNFLLETERLLLRKLTLEDAACAVIEHARVDVKLPRLTAIVSPENEASVRLIKKLGMRFESVMQMPGEDQEVSVYTMPFTA